MRRIESIEDDMRGVVTYEVSNGQRICMDARMVREIGVTQALRRAGLPVPTERLPVFHHGRRVGTMPPDFDPSCVRSQSWLYDARSGDFRREGDTWVAAHTLGPGDIESVAGFISDAR